MKLGAYLLLALILGSTVGVYAVGITVRKIPSSGRVEVVGIGAYWDDACTQPVSEILWGTLEPSETANRTFYIVNTGNTALTLHLRTASWSPPEAETFISLTWDAEGLSLEADGRRAVNLTLTVSATIRGVDSFTFDTILEGVSP
jgi:hypothetical protein